MKLAVIIPYAQEGANTLFTCRAVHEDLLDVDHEVIVVDNMCPELEAQLATKNLVPDSGHAHNDDNGAPVESDLKVAARSSRWLKYLRFDECLSHWQCKAAAIEFTTADTLLFVDAHCIPKQGSLRGMYWLYSDLFSGEESTLHLPLTYYLTDDKRLIYSIRANLSEGFVGYTFCPASREESYYEVPCMSTCGCMITRGLYEKLFGAWGTLTSYGGGENILNFVLSIQGVKHHIYSKGTLFHHGNPRGYHWTWDGFHYNRATAMYLVGGEDFMWKYVHNLKGNPAVIQNLGLSVVQKNSGCRGQIESHVKMTIEDYVKRWTVDRV
jgi:hypothetical protein